MEKKESEGDLKKADSLVTVAATSSSGMSTPSRFGVVVMSGQRTTPVRQLDFSSSGNGVGTSSCGGGGGSERRLPPSAALTGLISSRGTLTTGLKRANPDGTFGTPKKTKKQCNCRNSKCLKLYCECFTEGVYCDGCNCVNCHNNEENEAARKGAVDSVLARKPDAFKPKIASSPTASRNSWVVTHEAPIPIKHNKGCNCKKSGCLKKYCECFQANVLCSDNCKCMDCKNFEGSEDRRALYNGDPCGSMQHSAAVTGGLAPVDFSSSPTFSKRKGLDLLPGTSTREPLIHRPGQYPQGNRVYATSASPLLPSSATAENFGSSNSTYRSVLADIISPQHIKQLCKVLVVVSGMVAKTQSVKNNLEKIQGEENKKIPDSFSRDQADKISTDNPGSDCSDSLKERPLSPGTMELMCDEVQDPIFRAAIPLDRHLTTEHDVTDDYIEQEKLVLTHFRDFLQMISIDGEVKAKRYSSLNERSTPSQPTTVTSSNIPPAKVGLPKSNGHTNNTEIDM